LGHSEEITIRCPLFSLGKDRTYLWDGNLFINFRKDRCLLQLPFRRPPFTGASHSRTNSRFGFACPLVRLGLTQHLSLASGECEPVHYPEENQRVTHH
jgi:hypothetical protein